MTHRKFFSLLLLWGGVFAIGPTTPVHGKTSSFEPAGPVRLGHEQRGDVGPGGDCVHVREAVCPFHFSPCLPLGVCCVNGISAIYYKPDYRNEQWRRTGGRSSFAGEKNSFLLSKIRSFIHSFCLCLLNEMDVHTLFRLRYHTSPTPQTNPPSDVFMCLLSYTLRLFLVNLFESACSQLTNELASPSHLPEKVPATTMSSCPFMFSIPLLFSGRGKEPNYASSFPMDGYSEITPRPVS